MTAVIFNKLIGAMPCAAGLTVHKRIGEAAYVTRGDPGFGVHNNSRIESDVIFVFLNEFFPPGLFNVILEFDS